MTNLFFISIRTKIFQFIQQKQKMNNEYFFNLKFWNKIKYLHKLTLI
jgi:hypothetical protein